MAKRFNKEDVDRFYDYGINMSTRTIYLGSVGTDSNDAETGTDYAMAERAIKGLHILEHTNNQPITILTNNFGGDVIHAMAIFDAIKQCKSHVTVIGYGYVCSAASIIMQSADERVLSPYSVFMFHAGTDAHAENHPKSIEKWLHFNKKYGSKINSILLNSINLKRQEDKLPLMTKEEFEKYNDFDTILTAEEAIEWGFADKLLEE
jgi:ATP-dependent protease ClpP protease subunit